MPKILVIDDDPSMLKIVCRMLSSAGYDVVSAADSSEGLDIFRRQKPDMVVTDLVMPTVDGIQTIERLRELAPGTLIVAMSGFGPYLDIASRVGADACIAKPFRAPEFLALIDRVGKQAQEVRN